jgi:hypothetical protein
VHVCSSVRSVLVPAIHSADFWLDAHLRVVGTLRGVGLSHCAIHGGGVSRAGLGDCSSSRAVAFSLPCSVRAVLNLAPGLVQERGKCMHHLVTTLQKCAPLFASRASCTGSKWKRVLQLRLCKRSSAKSCAFVSDVVASFPCMRNVGAHFKAVRKACGRSVSRTL